MKTKKTVKLLALLLATILFLSSSAMTASADNPVHGLRTSAQAQKYIEKFAQNIDEEGVKYSVKDKQRIESFSNGKSYVLYLFSPTGYAIYDEISGVVEEMMLSSESPYKKDIEDGILYYGGPMNYIMRSGDEYILLNDNSVLSEEDICELKKLELYTVENRKKTVTGIPQTTEYYYMSSSHYFTQLLGDQFGTNTNSTCTQLACVIMLGYYNYYVNTLFVPEGYHNGYGTTNSFYTYIQSFIGSSPSGLANAANGLNSYFSAIFFTSPTAYYDLGSHNTVFARVNSRVYYNRPTVIAMFTGNSNCDLNHSVVAYGYMEELNGIMMTSAHYFVHTGWHDPKLGSYAWDWFSDDLYID